MDFSGAIGSNLDSAAVDIGTNIAIVPDEFTSNEYMVNMAQAEFMSGTFSAPSSVFPITFPDCYDEFGEANDWTYAAIESSTHNLFIADEFGSCAAVQPLPPSVISGAPPLPTVFSWGHVPSLQMAPGGTTELILTESRSSRAWWMGSLMVSWFGLTKLMSLESTCRETWRTPAIRRNNGRNQPGSIRDLLQHPVVPRRRWVAHTS